MAGVPLKKTVLVAAFKIDCRVAIVERNLRDVCELESRKKGK